MLLNTRPKFLVSIYLIKNRFCEIVYKYLFRDFFITYKTNNLFDKNNEKFFNNTMVHFQQTNFMSLNKKLRFFAVSQD